MHDAAAHAGAVPHRTFIKLISFDVKLDMAAFWCVRCTATVLADLAGIACLNLRMALFQDVTSSGAFPRNLWRVTNILPFL